jgi:hypothetical protein
MCVVDGSRAQSIYSSDGLYMLGMGISFQHGVCESSRGILGVYPCHALLVLYYCGLRGLCQGTYRTSKLTVHGRVMRGDA